MKKVYFERKLETISLNERKIIESKKKKNKKSFWSAAES